MFWKRVLLSWLTLLAVVFASAAATASSNVSPKTHVGAIDLAAAICIEAQSHASAEEHLENPRLSTAVTSDVPHAARGIGGAERLAIGRGKDLANGLKAGETKLQWPSKLPNFKAEWKMNSGLLRQWMQKGQPIRDVSPGETGGIFLNAERNLLQSRGWTFESGSGFWLPPGG